MPPFLYFYLDLLLINNCTHFKSGNKTNNAAKYNPKLHPEESEDDDEALFVTATSNELLLVIFVPLCNVCVTERVIVEVPLDIPVISAEGLFFPFILTTDSLLDSHKYSK